MKAIIEVTSYLMVDVKDTNEAECCGGRLSEEVADCTAGYSPHVKHITTGFSVCAASECTSLTPEAVKEASQWLDEREYPDRSESSNKENSWT